MNQVYISSPVGALDPTFATRLAEVLAARGFESSATAESAIQLRDFRSSSYSSILASDLVIAVVDRANPNVYFEIGVAIGAGKQVILIADPAVPMPFDLASVPCVSFTRDSAKDLAALHHALSKLDYTTKRSRARRWSPTKELGSFTSDPDWFAAMDSNRFEHLIEGMLRKKGLAVRRVPPHFESRCDFVASMPNERMTIVVEVKKLPPQSRVSLDQVFRLREAVSLLGAVAGLLISTSGFTSSAIALAAEKGPKLILLSLEEFLRTKEVKHLLESTFAEGFDEPENEGAGTAVKRRIFSMHSKVNE